jgi:hypothetical protein
MISRLRKTIAAVLAGLLLAALAAPGPASAAPARPAAALFFPGNFTVNSVNDVPADFTNDLGYDNCHTHFNNSTCTLRAAIMNANLHASGATIHLPAGIYTLTLPIASPLDDSNGNLDISNTVTIIGAGAASTIIDAGALDGVFRLHPSAVVTMTGLTIRGGNGGNSASAGGIDNDGRLTLSYSRLVGNRTTVAGGGLLVGSGATASLDHDTVEGNSSSNGGGVLNAGTLELDDSTVDFNTTSQEGGGVYNNSFGHLTVFNSTISNNSALHRGGGLYNSGDFRLFHTTLAGNLADDNGVTANDGGGLFSTTAAPTHTVQLFNSLLIENAAGIVESDCAGQPATLKDYNEIEAVCSLNGSNGTDHFGFDPFLAALADNGGPTRTRALQVGSVAVDKIPPALCRDPFGTAPVPDQRGMTRPVGPNCDIGAYEGALPLPYFGSNLVVNGDAEAAAGSPSGNVVAMPGWDGTLRSVTVVPYNAPNGFPSVPTDTVPANHGGNFFAGAQFTTAVSSQIVGLQPISNVVDGDRARFVFSADLGGFGAQADNAVVTLQFDNGSFQVLLSRSLGPATPAMRGNQTGLLSFSLPGTVPPGARSAVVTLTMTRFADSYNDGYADNISLVLWQALFMPLLLR